MSDTRVARHGRNNKFTDKQKALFPFIVQGMTSKEIACKLDISASCVDSRIQHIQDITGCLTRGELTEYFKEQYT